MGGDITDIHKKTREGESKTLMHYEHYEIGKGAAVYLLISHVRKYFAT